MQIWWVVQKTKHARKGIPITTTNTCLHFELPWKEHRYSESVFSTKLKITVVLDMLPCSAVQRYKSFKTTCHLIFVYRVVMFQSNVILPAKIKIALGKAKNQLDATHMKFIHCS
jgi:hypothetical protein